MSQLRSHAVAGLDNITTNDICCGRLKAVLALFFALSRYKQQSKQSKCVNNTNGFSIKAEIHQQPQTNTLSVSVGGGVSEKVSNSSATALLVQSMQNGNDTTMVNRWVSLVLLVKENLAFLLTTWTYITKQCICTENQPSLSRWRNKHLWLDKQQAVTLSLDLQLN